MLVNNDLNEDCTHFSDADEQKKEYMEWLIFAKTDYECAVYLDKAPFYPKPMNVVCYHCQQAAEKAVKALIVYFGKQGGMPKAHDLSFLINQIKDIIRKQKGIQVGHELLTTADSLTKYGIATRYPNEIEVDEYQTKKALVDSKIILDWVNDVIAADVDELFDSNNKTSENYSQ